MYIHCTESSSRFPTFFVSLVAMGSHSLLFRMALPRWLMTGCGLSDLSGFNEGDIISIDTLNEGKYLWIILLILFLVFCLYIAHYTSMTIWDIRLRLLFDSGLMGVNNQNVWFNGTVWYQPSNLYMSIDDSKWGYTVLPIIFKTPVSQWGC